MANRRALAGENQGDEKITRENVLVVCVRRVCVCTDNIKSYPKERNKVYVTCLSLFPNFHTTKIILLTSC